MYRIARVVIPQTHRSSLRLFTSTPSRMAELITQTQYAMGALKPGSHLSLIPFKPEALGDHDVFVDVKYGGMCHSDLHMTCNEWAAAKQYPMVPGHEVVGIVSKVGPKVTKFKVGDRVGYGPQRGSCGHCESCGSHNEQVCEKFEGMYDPKFGGYATSITVGEDFTFHIPEGIPSEVAGPLLCAGITTFAPLQRNVKAGDRVGIVGIGGLGHMALQYAHALGCETWAISTSASKEAEARKFGATHFLVSTDKQQMDAATRTFDFILCCATGKFDSNIYLKLLKARKSFCLVGLPAVSTPISFEPFSIVDFENSIVGSKIGGTKAMKEMLEFSAKHKCFPAVEVIDFADANTGFERIEKGLPRYRMVLKIEGFREAQQAK